MQGHTTPLYPPGAQAREDVSSVPAAQGLTSHKHSHTSGPLLGTRLVQVQVPRAPRLCPCSHGQPPAFADPYVPWLMLSPSWHALLPLCPGPTHTRVAQTLPSPQSTLLPPGDGALPAEPPVLSRPPQVRSTFRLVLPRSIPVPLTCIGPHLTVFVPCTQPRSGIGSVA